MNGTKCGLSQNKQQTGLYSLMPSSLCLANKCASRRSVPIAQAHTNTHGHKLANNRIDSSRVTCMRNCDKSAHDKTLTLRMSEERGEQVGLVREECANAKHRHGSKHSKGHRHFVCIIRIGDRPNDHPDADTHMARAIGQRTSRASRVAVMQQWGPSSIANTGLQCQCSSGAGPRPRRVESGRMPHEAS